VIIIFSITPRSVDWAMMRKKKTMLKKETVKEKASSIVIALAFSDIL